MAVRRAVSCHRHDSERGAANDFGLNETESKQWCVTRALRLFSVHSAHAGSLQEIRLYSVVAGHNRMLKLLKVFSQSMTKSICKLVVTT